MPITDAEIRRMLPAVEKAAAAPNSVWRLFRLHCPEKTGTRVARDAAGLMGLRGLFHALSFLVSLLLTHLLSTAEYGAYSYALAWVAILGVPAILGMDQLVVRETAVYLQRGSWNLLHGLLRRANQAVLFVSLGLAFIAGLIAWTLPNSASTPAFVTFLVALPLLPLVALCRVRQAAMQGLKSIVLGQVPEMLVMPLLLIAFLSCAGWFGTLPLSASPAMALNLLATGLAFASGAYLLRQALPASARTAVPAYRTRTWSRSVLPLTFLAGINVLYAQADILLLGAIKGTRLVGTYAVADRGADLITFILIAAYSAMSPHIAAQYARGDLKSLQGLVTKVARITLVLTLPLATGLILFGHWLLLLFGPDFTQARLALTILSLGQLFNVAVGSMGLQLLTMTGHERDSVRAIGISLGANLVLNSLFIPLWGLEGAAIASASGMVLWDLLIVWSVYRRVGIHCTALGTIPWLKNQPMPT